MAKFNSYRETSRTDWGVNEDNHKPSLEVLRLGALLRIADSLERIARLMPEQINCERKTAGAVTRIDKRMAVKRKLK